MTENNTISIIDIIEMFENVAIDLIINDTKIKKIVSTLPVGQYNLNQIAQHIVEYKEPKKCNRCGIQLLGNHYGTCNRCKEIIKDLRSKSLRLRFEIFKRDEFKCIYCGRSSKDNTVLVIDHKIPLSRGGDDSYMNLVTSCWECNSGKGDVAIDTNTILNNK